MDLVEDKPESHHSKTNHNTPTIQMTTTTNTVNSAKLLPLHPFLSTNAMEAALGSSHPHPASSPYIPTILHDGNGNHGSSLMNGNKEAYCIRWKGFQSNMTLCLEAIESDRDFADMTLACELGFSRQAHKLILASCSPYFRRILRDTMGQHPVVILNDVQGETLDALLTYMYRGEVSVSENKLSAFFAAATSLEVKGLEDAHQVFGGMGVLSDPLSVAKVTAVETVPTIPSHHLSDLSLLAAAATGLATKPSTANVASTSSSSSSSTSEVGSISKRRKTVPRRLELNSGSNFKIPKVEVLTNTLIPTVLGNMDTFPTPPNDENNPMNNDNMAMNLSMKSPPPPPISEASSKFVARAELLNIPHPNNSFRCKAEEDQESSSTGPKITLPTSPLALDMSSQGFISDGVPIPPSSTSPAGKSSVSETGSPITSEEGSLPPPQMMMNFKEGEDSRPLPVSASTTPEQMAALLGPSWKSRQPRLCQYCQRMFSNKFNLKQHILNMHTVGRELHCEICQKKVKNKWYLRRHHKSGWNETPLGARKDPPRVKNEDDTTSLNRSSGLRWKTE
ncbi:hypothetical protein TCAL_04647 [Tigriopus californicus]|uniref:BTB domain-containing protein n=1 Tax=Tigriopus californicus TaxID=6832 RepID=A0A553NFK8_TIGCA|nr:hypothetical protein TCAL_04647 [Tigriopus californicus]